MAHVMRWLEQHRHSIKQFSRFIVVGVASNAIGYMLYISLTFSGIPPKVTMTVLYIIGAVMAFWGNRQFTFGSNARLTTTGMRYALVHLVGYSILYVMQTVFYEHYGFAHQIVQLAAIAVVAVYLFVAMKLFVFGDTQ